MQFDQSGFRAIRCGVKCAEPRRKRGRVKRRFQEGSDEAEFIGQEVQKRLIENITPGNMAILVKHKEQIPLIEANLIKKKIGYQLENEFPFYLKTPYLNILRCLRFAITDLKIEKGIYPENDRQTKLYYEDLEIMSNMFQLDLKTSEIEGIRKKTNWFESSITRELNLLSRMDEESRFNLLTFSSFITQLKSKLNQPAAEVLSWAAEKYGAIFSQNHNSPGIQTSLLPLYKLCGPASNCIDFMDRIYRLVKDYKAKKQSLFQSDLYILTLEQCLGRQWDYVFLTHPLAGLEDSATNKQLYMGAGRAVKELIFTCSNTSFGESKSKAAIKSKQCV